MTGSAEIGVGGVREEPGGARQEAGVLVEKAVLIRGVAAEAIVLGEPIAGSAGTVAGDTPVII